jgi:hypothetical protein
MKISTINEKDNNENLENIIIRIKKLVSYYTNLHTLLITYLEELMNNFESKEIIEELKNKILGNKYNNYITKINDSLLQLTNNNIYIIYNNIILTKLEIDKLIQLTYKYNIYDEKTLLSDTSKNNINQNKSTILDIYNKILKKYIYYINIINIFITSNFEYNYNNYINLYNYFINNLEIIDIYLLIIKELLNKEDVTFKDLILFNHKNIKDLLLNNELDENKYKYNINNINEISYLFKSNSFKLKHNNIITKFSQYIPYKNFNNLNDLFLEISGSNYNFKNNKLDESNLQKIVLILKNVYKIDKKYFNIIILESNYDNINYNIKNLINPQFIIDKNNGIDKNFINKTKTIFTKNEILSELKNKNDSIEFDIYLNNIQNIYFINNFNINNKKEYLNTLINTLINTNYILIYKLDTKYYLMKEANNINNLIYSNNFIIKFQNILPIILTKPNYYIENSNILLEKSILDNINKQNMLNLYNQAIENDFKNLPKIDNLELKNILINKIKTNLNINKDFLSNKTDNIQKIIDIIINEIYLYIQKINNIEFTFEIYMTYFSNINSLINKFKKELNDNYDNNILNNIDNILDNIYNNIITINNNILDKYYLLSLTE